MSESVSGADVRIAKEKPFPWRCPHCRQPKVWRVTVPYQCRRLHEGRSIVVDVQNLAVPRCGNCGELVFDYLAEEQINHAFKAMVESRGDRIEMHTPVRSPVAGEPLSAHAPPV